MVTGAGRALTRRGAGPSHRGEQAAMTRHQTISATRGVGPRRGIPAALILGSLAACAGSKPAQPGVPPTLEGKAPSGLVDMDEVQVAYMGNAGGGRGTLTYQGKSYPFDIAGLGVGGIGISKVDAKGEVYNLTDVAQFGGLYGLGQYGAVAGTESIGEHVARERQARRHAPEGEAGGADAGPGGRRHRRAHEPVSEGGPWRWRQQRRSHDEARGAEGAHRSARAGPRLPGRPAGGLHDDAGAAVRAGLPRLGLRGREPRDGPVRRGRAQGRPEGGGPDAHGIAVRPALVPGHRAGLLRLQLAPARMPPDTPPALSPTGRPRRAAAAGLLAVALAAGHARAEEAGGGTEALAKQAQNPIADLISVPFQDNVAAGAVATGRPGREPVPCP